jgi:ABC-2 type transport system ATP-binding protein
MWSPAPVDGRRCGGEAAAVTSHEPLESLQAAPPAVSMAGLGRRFGDRWAVRDLRLELHRGEVFGLLGPNGAGKTTTIRLLAALIAPSTGTAAVDGLDVVHDAHRVRSRIGVLTESPGLYEKLSAARNLDYFGRLHGLSAALRAHRIERYLRLFDLWERRDDAIGGMSKGMKQKVAIARALLHEPPVLFLDEPTAALDPEAAAIVREAISTLRGSGRTIVLCTHVLPEAERLCDRIGFLRETLLRVGTPARLRAGLGGRVRLEVRLVPGSDRSGLARLLSTVDGATATPSDHGLAVSVVDADRDTPRLVQALAAAGAAILEVRRQEATLEDVYFEVMGVRATAEGEAA